MNKFSFLIAWFQGCLNKFPFSNNWYRQNIEFLREISLMEKNQLVLPVFIPDL